MLFRGQYRISETELSATIAAYWHHQQILLWIVTFVSLGNLSSFSVPANLKKQNQNTCNGTETQAACSSLSATLH